MFGLLKYPWYKPKTFKLFFFQDLFKLGEPNKKKDNDIDDTKCRGLRNIRYRYEPEKHGNKEEVLRVIRTLFEREEDYYKPVKIGNAFDHNFIEYERHGDKDKTLLIEEQLDKFRPNISDMINDIKTQDEWKIHLTMAINFFSSKDSERNAYYAFKQ